MANHNPINNLKHFAHPAKTTIPAVIKPMAKPTKAAAPKGGRAADMVRAMDAAEIPGAAANNIRLTTPKPAMPKPMNNPTGVPQAPKPAAPKKKGY